MSTETIDTETIDRDRVDAFVGKALGDLSAATSVVLCVLGDRLGLFSALDEGGRQRHRHAAGDQPAPVAAALPGRPRRRRTTSGHAGALGIGGRVRRTGDPVERARTTVTRRIGTACKAIVEVHPEVATHLDRSIRTGRFCAYRPEQPVRWRT